MTPTCAILGRLFIDHSPFPEVLVLLTRILLIGFGGFFGAASRHLISRFTRTLTNDSFPYGTLTVNVTGSFLLAFLIAGVFEQGLLPDAYRYLFLIGFLGAFTTFSTFSHESLTLLNNGLHVSFFMNVTANVLLCLLGAALGLYFGGILRS